MAKASAKPAAAAPVAKDGNLNKRKREEKLLEKTNKKEKVEEPESEEEEEEEEEEEDEEDDDTVEDDDREMEEAKVEDSKTQEDLPSIDFSANDAATSSGKQSCLLLFLSALSLFTIPSSPFDATLLTSTTIHCYSRKHTSDASLLP